MAEFLLGLDTQPMEAKSVDALPDGPTWQFEPKWDGFRCLAYKSGGAVDLRAKSGKPLGRYFPEMLEALAQARADDFVLDGELMVPHGDTVSFGALQDRVHPAESRVPKLAAETPAMLVVFDCIAAGRSGSLLGAALPDRRAALDRLMPLFAWVDQVRLSPFTTDRREAQRWLTEPLQALAIRAGVDLLPGWARRMHGLQNPVIGRPLIRVGTLGLAEILRWSLRR